MVNAVIRREKAVHARPPRCFVAQMPRHVARDQPSASATAVYRLSWLLRLTLRLRQMPSAPTRKSAVAAWCALSGTMPSAIVPRHALRGGIAEAGSSRRPPRPAPMLCRHASVACAVYCHVIGQSDRVAEMSLCKTPCSGDAADPRFEFHCAIIYCI